MLEEMPVCLPKHRESKILFKSRVHLELMFSVYGVRQGLRSLPSQRVSSYASTICGELSYWVALVPGAKICWPNNKCGS